MYYVLIINKSIEESRKKMRKINFKKMEKNYSIQNKQKKNILQKNDNPLFFNINVDILVHSGF